MKKIIVNNPIVDYFLASFRNKATDTYRKCHYSSWADNLPHH